MTCDFWWHGVTDGSAGTARVGQSHTGPHPTRGRDCACALQVGLLPRALWHRITTKECYDICLPCNSWNYSHNGTSTPYSYSFVICLWCCPFLSCCWHGGPYKSRPLTHAIHLGWSTALVLVLLYSLVWHRLGSLSWPGICRWAVTTVGKTNMRGRNCVMG